MLSTLHSIKTKNTMRRTSTIYPELQTWGSHHTNATANQCLALSAKVNRTQRGMQVSSMKQALYALKGTCQVEATSNSDTNLGCSLYIYHV